MAKDSIVSTMPVEVIMNTVLDGLITIDEAGTIFSFNPAAERIFQYSAEEVIGKNVKYLMPKPYCDEHHQYIANYLTSGEGKVIGVGREVAAKRKDGSVFPMELGVNEMSVAGARMFVGTIRDITERKQAEASRLTETNRLQAILATVLDGIITIDRLGVICSFNPAAERIFGYREQEVLGKNVKMLMPNPYHDEHDGYLHNYLDTGEKKVIGIGRKVEARRKDGEIFPIELGVNEMQVDGQRMFVGSIRDISERVAAEQSIVDYLAKLTRSNQELDDFAYIASHDLKEPLRGLNNNALFLQEDYGEVLDEDGLKRLDRIGFLCKRMEALVDDLLYFSRLGRQDLAIKNTNLNDVISDIQHMMETNLVEANAQIIVPQPLPEITCDATRVTEVFRNLISNAVKYNDKEKKLVEVGYMDSPVGQCQLSQYIFYVKDNGIGIKESFFEDVFRIFKRLNTEDDDVKGTGVGLTFVKKIIERHGGKIWLESDLGLGTTFYFYLSLKEPVL